MIDLLRQAFRVEHFIQAFIFMSRENLLLVAQHYCVQTSFEMANIAGAVHFNHKHCVRNHGKTQR